MFNQTIQCFLFVSLITVTLKLRLTKMLLHAQQGLVLTDVVMLKVMPLIPRSFSNHEPKQYILVGELEISLWSLGDHDMTLT